MALGSYETTPIEIAAAYTVFANKGVYLAPTWITGIRESNGQEISKKPVASRRVLEEDVAYLMTNMMEEVIRSGTGAGVRSLGFTFPAAGKTGTSHDGWFAGYTTKLICAVWIGFDDNAELDLEGARSALPIWAEFMKRAHARRPYRNATEFPQPSGVVVANIDPVTGKLASASNANAREEVYLQGTQPQSTEGSTGPGTAVSDWGAEPARPQRAPGASREVRPVPVSPKPSWAQ
jgi:penicillin-binding protein 1B